MPVERWSDEIWITRLSNEPALSEDLSGLHQQASNASNTPHMVVDLSSITHLNSSNLSQMLRLRKLAIDHEVKLKLVNPSDSVWVVFLATGLDKVFRFSTDVATALAELQMD